MQKMALKSIYHRSYFFDQGILFECQKCGACCSGAPGTVYVYKSEIEKIARYLSLRVSSFLDKYLYPFKGDYSVREYPDGRCPFFQDGCTIYPVRPGQCRTFPFWFENLRSPEKWRKVSKECPGIGRGRYYPKEQILKILPSTITDEMVSDETLALLQL